MASFFLPLPRMCSRVLSLETRSLADRSPCSLPSALDLESAREGGVSVSHELAHALGLSYRDLRHQRAPMGHAGAERSASTRAPGLPWTGRDHIGRVYVVTMYTAAE